MGKYEVFAPEMEYPEGMTEEQAYAVAVAHEMRRFACEFEYQMDNDDEGHCWVEGAKAAIEGGEVTAKELVEQAFLLFWDEETDFERYFSYTLERLV